MFVSVLVLTGIALGTAEKFISISAHQAALQYDYAPEVVGMFCVHLIDDELVYNEFSFPQNGCWFRMGLCRLFLPFRLLIGEIECIK